MATSASDAGDNHSQSGSDDDEVDDARAIASMRYLEAQGYVLSVEDTLQMVPDGVTISEFAVYLSTLGHDEKLELLSTFEMPRSHRDTTGELEIDAPTALAIDIILKSSEHPAVIELGVEEILSIWDPDDGLSPVEFARDWASYGYLMARQQ